MKTEVKLCCMQQTYEAPSAEIIDVFVEKGFADSEDNEEVGKDDVIDF